MHFRSATTTSLGLIATFFAFAACDRSATKQKNPAAALNDVRQLIQKSDSRGALAALDRYFPNDKSPEVAEERARAYDVAIGACTSAACRLTAAVAASNAHQSPARTAKADELRRAVLTSLATDHLVATPTLQRIKQLREVGDAADEVLAGGSGDAEITNAAKQAQAFSNSERAKVPLLKLDVTGASDLLGPVTMNDHNVPTFALDGAIAYLAVDSAGKCSGIYSIGKGTAGRPYKSTKWPADRLISQAVGHPVTVKAPASGSSVSRWAEGNVPIAVRWRNGEIAEIRVGDATP